MRTGRPSSTAVHNALFRALSAAGAGTEPALDDPFARSFLRGPIALTRPLLSTRVGRRTLRRFIDRRWPGVRTSVVARTALIDHELVDRLTHDANQVLLLGAGLDARPYRLAPLVGASVFEVDHPDTQRAKRHLIEQALGCEPSNVTFVETDFESGGLHDRLVDAGFDHDRRTVVVWEGVTNYLSEDAVDRTFRWLGGSAPGSAVLFTYIDRDLFVHPERYAGARRLESTLARVGEQLRFAIDPAQLPAYLAERGLDLRDDVGAAEYRVRFFGPCAGAIRGHEFYRVATADVCR